MEARQESAWDHTAELLATQWNIAAKHEVVKAAELNPYKKHARSSRLPTLSMMADWLEP